MFKNHLRIASRNLLKNRSFSIINIAGLAIGMLAVFLIAVWVQNQFRYDNFYSKQENIYKLMNRTDKDGWVGIHDITMPAAAPALEENYPEVEHAARVLWTENSLLTAQEVRLKARGNQVDPSFLDIFDFPVIKGVEGQLLSAPGSIVLTESLARSLFGDKDPLHQPVLLQNESPYQVTGVLKDLPGYTDFQFQYLIPIEAERAKGFTSWGNNSLMTYVSLFPDVDVDAFNQKIRPLVTQNADYLKWSSVFLYALSKSHLYSEFENGVPAGGMISQVRLIGGIGLLILFIACINFMNLSTARAQKRAKEVGVRKVIGATKQNLVIQFLLEAFLLVLASGVLATALTALALPAFNHFLEKPLEVGWSDPLLWSITVTFLLFVGLLAGAYPAFVLSSFRPIKALKNQSERAQRFFTLREGLVVTQFAIAVCLIIATLVIRAQIKYGSDRPVGYDTSQLIEVAAEGDLEKNYKALKSELIRQGLAQSVTRTGGWTIADGYASSGGNFSWEGATPDQISDSFFQLTRAESDYVKTVGLTLIEGRDIDYERLPGDSSSVLLNQTAVKRMGLENPIGKFLKWGEDTYTIVGVINDFIFKSPFQEVDPLLVYSSNKYLSNIVIRTSPQLPMDRILTGLEQTLKQFNPAYPFSYRFVDQQFASKFKEQQQMRSLALIFSSLAIFISCLGLFGLASFIAETRLKEIGIRKALGASVAEIWTLLSKDFIKLVVISFFIGFPAAWWMMDEWLNGYSYRISLQWWMFGAAGMLAVGIAFLTVSSQSIKAAYVKPVDSLRED